MQIPRDYTGAPILSLQTMLGVIGAALEDFPPVAADGIYADETAAAVWEFQKRYSLPQTGQTDNVTWNRIVDVYVRLSPSVLPAAPLQILWQPLQVIRAGERNANLYPIQSMLLALGDIFARVPKLAVTGVHDAPSVEAVKWFQRKSGLPDSGTLTQTDWLYLTGLYRLSASDETLPL